MAGWEVASSLLVDDGRYESIDRARRRKGPFLAEKEKKTNLSSFHGNPSFWCMHVMPVGGWVKLACSACFLAAGLAYLYIFRGGSGYMFHLLRREADGRVLLLFILPGRCLCAMMSKERKENPFIHCTEMRILG
jgi:hypothetical protein